ncbi:hypothetical protein ACIQCJ_04535 [Streptomyces sp. NPDC093221]|uniref:hypothetical protein n=1 Tax=Streptomyces sp. NPDC093221 TaxID=3366032 RepID=UPI00382FEADF
MRTVLPSRGRKLESCGDLTLVRSDKLIRWGGVIPPLSVFPTLVALRLLDGTAGELAVVIGLFALAGQALVWTGMRGMQRCQGWADGVLFYLAAGGLFSGMTLFLTGIPAVMPIPLLAPATAWLAKVRLRRKPPAEAAP